MLALVSPESLVPKSHPIRSVKSLCNEVLRHLSGTFDEMYSSVGRPSIPPESLLKASVLMALYTIRSERQFCEQLRYNMLFRWFLDMDMTDEPFDASTFSKNRERMLEHNVAEEFFQLVVASAQSAGLLSSEHFSVDGTLIEAWASMKSFKPRDDSDDDDSGSGSAKNPEVDFHGKKRKNDTHASTTDPEAKLYRKSAGTAAKLCFSAHALMENRNGLLVDIRLSQAGTAAEWDEGLDMLSNVRAGSTVAADRGYDVRRFVSECRSLGVTPHVAQRKRSCIDARTTRHSGLWNQPANPKAHRGNLWMGEDGWEFSKDQIQRRGKNAAGRLSGRRLLQPPENSETRESYLMTAMSRWKPPRFARHRRHGEP